MAQFWVASVPLTPRVTVYCHPIRSSDQIEMIMYSVTLICKSYACFSDFAVMVLVKNSIPGRLLFYWAEKYFQALQESVFFVLIAIFSQPNEKANCAVYISLPGLCCITQHPLLSNLGSPLGFISVFKINAAGGLSKSDTFFSQIENRLLFYWKRRTPLSVWYNCSSRIPWANVNRNDSVVSCWCYIITIDWFGNYFSNSLSIGRICMDEKHPIFIH